MNLNNASIIIDGKDRQGRRVSVSIDDVLFKLLLAEKGGLEKARAFVKAKIAEGYGKIDSRYIRHEIYLEIIKPNVKRRYLDSLDENGH